jgi:2-polyprenyl-6-methoxyphenol hydroxylase-like FAD-dependent oxidoreductase
VRRRKGVRSLVLESSPELRASGFAFTTWTNAFRALDALGVGDKIREHHLLYERWATDPTFFAGLFYYWATIKVVVDLSSFFYRLVTFSASTGEAAAKVSVKMQGKWL